MGASIKGYMDTVREILTVASKVCYVNRSYYRLGELEEFLKATGEFPSDVLHVLEAASILANPTGGFPSAEEIQLLESCWNEAWGWSGQLSWKYSQGVLTLKYSPKKTGAYYEVHFTPGAPGGHLFFPLMVRFHAWADMDETENHHDECGLLREDENECYCEPDIVTTEVRTFTYDEQENFRPLFVQWLTKLLQEDE